MTNQSELEQKTERLVRMMPDEDVGGVLINAQHNFAWLTCGGTNGIDSSREAGAGWLFVRRDGRRFVLANSIEMPRLLDEELAGQDYEPVEFEWEEERANPALVTDRARALLEQNGQVVSDLPIGGSDRIIEPALARLRYALTEQEVERFRALGRDSGKALAEVMRGLEPGMTEREIARRASDALAARGARAVVTLVAADERLGKYRHPVATDRQWEKVVMVVVCARRGGLIASLTRIACARAVPDDLRRRTEAAARVNAELFAATRPGARGSDLYRVTARGYEREGFPGEERLHHQGGATGYRTREWVAHPRSEERVQSSQAFAWNPSITGTKIEETCIAFDDGIEVVTASPDWPAISVEAGGREYALPGILAL